MSKAIGWVLLMPFAAAVGIMAVLWNAWCFWHVWRWFAVPHGLPALTVIDVAGLGLLVNFFYRLRDRKPNQEESLYMLTLQFVQPGWVLLLGWVLKELGP